MIYKDFKNLLLSKSTRRTEILEDSDIFDERVLTALKRVATDTIPLHLVVTIPVGEPMTIQAYRKLDVDTYIRMPRKPIHDASIVDIDDELMDAVALYVMAGLERSQAKVNMGLYYREIEMNNDRLVETTLVVASNELADRFEVFP